MAIEPVKRLWLVVLRDSAAEVLEHLYHLGCVHLAQVPGGERQGRRLLRHLEAELTEAGDRLEQLRKKNIRMRFEKQFEQYIAEGDEMLGKENYGSALTAYTSARSMFDGDEAGLGGSLGSLKIKGIKGLEGYYDTAWPEPFGIIADEYGKMQIGRQKLTDSDLPFIDGDFHVELI